MLFLNKILKKHEFQFILNRINNEIIIFPKTVNMAFIWTKYRSICVIIDPFLANILSYLYNNYIYL